MFEGQGDGVLNLVGVFGTEVPSGVPCSGGGDVRATVVESKTFSDVFETLDMFKMAPRGEKMASKPGECGLSPNGAIFVAK